MRVVWLAGLGIFWKSFAELRAREVKAGAVRGLCRWCGLLAHAFDPVDVERIGDGDELINKDKTGDVPVDILFEPAVAEICPIGVAADTRHAAVADDDAVAGAGGGTVADGGCVHQVACSGAGKAADGGIVRAGRITKKGFFTLGGIAGPAGIIVQRISAAAGIRASGSIHIQGECSGSHIAISGGIKIKRLITESGVVSAASVRKE
jgi:hypothetical protein